MAVFLRMKSEMIKYELSARKNSTVWVNGKIAE